MRFSSTTTASILFSLLALEAVGAPAPQYDTTEIIMTTVTAAAGSATDSVSPSDPASVSISTSTSVSAGVKSCKAPSGRAQAWRQHRRPRPSASASASASEDTTLPAPNQEVSSSESDTAPEPTSAESITSATESEASPSPSETPMPSEAETAPVVTATAIQAGGDGEVVENPSSSQAAEPSVVETSSSSEVSSFTESSSSFTSSFSTQPSASASAQGSGGDAPAGFEADILKAHNALRVKWGAQPLGWSQDLANQGNDYYKSKNCAFAHSGMDPGENIAGGSGGGADFAPLGGQAVLDMWGSEAVNWTVGTAVPSEDPERSTGHFTQVVWKETTQLGCGEISCGSSWIAFCEYWPRGNMQDGYADNKETGEKGNVGSPQ